MITEIFDTLGEVVRGLLTVLTELFGGVVNIFYNPATTADGVGTFTFLGYVLIIGVGTPLVFWGLNWIIGLFRKMLKK